jgi:hypothetical protein
MTLGTFSPKPVNVTSRVGATNSNGPESEAMRLRIIKLVTDASHGAARNLQKEIGPSEYGHPCTRQIAFKVAGIPKNPDWLDPLPSIIGTAMHSWMETALLPLNDWIPERKVHVTESLFGHSDAYHVPTRTVVDWKFLGNTQHREYASGYVSSQYRVQAHSYGLGFFNAGFPVDRVALAIFSRSKTLQDLYVWSEPWDRAVAQHAVDRLQTVRQYVAVTGAGPLNRTPILQIKPTSGDTCYFCPFKGTSQQGLCEAFR